PEFLRALGVAIGELNAALLKFDSPCPDSHEWDLTRASESRDNIDKIPDAHRRELAEYFLQQFVAVATPHLGSLRRSIIHGDLNDANILIDSTDNAPRVTGILDFGDMVENPMVCDLAIMLAYAMLNQTDPISAACHVISGFHTVLPLEEAELDVIYPLACGRLAVSVCMSARNRMLTPDNEHQFFTEAPAWEALERLGTIAPTDARTRFRQACGFESNESLPSESELKQSRTKHIGPSLSLSYRSPLHIVSGRGQFLMDQRGDAYLDLVNNVCHVGHCHPHVVAAGQQQLARLNTNTRYLYQQLTDYASRLCSMLPDSLEVCYFVCSGSEANDLALRMARTHTGRKDILIHSSAYHGHTSTLIDISPYKFMGKGGKGQPEDWVHVATTPDIYRGPHHGDNVTEAYVADVIRTLESTPPIGAFMSESVLGCGGQIFPPAGYMKQVAKEVRSRGGICILDEVQVGFGRMGSHFWGFELQEVVPDIVVLGKPIGNGHPMGAVITTREIADSFNNGMEFFSTFGGNPVSCAIGMAVLDVIENEGLQENAREVGAHFKSGLEELAEQFPIIGDVRGQGLFLGVELVTCRESRKPAAAAATQIVNALRDRGILLSTDGPDNNVLKIKPPMVVTKHDIDRVLRTLQTVLTSVGPL
ncbi:MAG: aminotransferase class III-fold pyridoxal phosphate-dependent enzyme, partial [Planctomycetota bacterium]